MRGNEEVLQFITSSFRSVWALELLILLRSSRRSWPGDELVKSLRASDLVVTKALDALEAAGLAARTGNAAEYLPVNDDVDALVGRAEQLYATKPDAVRRAIISSSFDGATAFADAFRLRRD